MSIDSGPALISRSLPLAVSSGLELRDLGASSGHQFLVEVGVAPQAPAALGSLCQQDPCALCQRRVTGGRGDQIRELLYRGELLVAVQRVGIRKNLNPYVGAIAVNVCG